MLQPMKKQHPTSAQLQYRAGVPAWFRNALLGAGCLFLVSCGGEKAKEETAQTEEQNVELAEDPNAPAEDTGLGVGPVKSAVDVSKFDAALADKGKGLFEAKCTACHRLTDEKVVGPGLKGVTERRKPEWIMNMVLNPT